MEYAAIPGLSDRVPRLILGSAAFGQMDDAAIFPLMDAYRAAGGNAIETAHDYGRGRAEEAIGRWLRARGLSGPGRDMLVMTKAAHYESGTLASRLRPELIVGDLTRSRARLGVETVDLLMLHRDDPSQAVGPIVDALDAAVAAGHVRAYGGSNWSSHRVEEANAYAAAQSKRPFVVSSPNLALAVPSEPLWHDVRSVSGDEVELGWFRRTRFPLISWSSQARGYFAGPPPAGDPRVEEIARVYDTPGNRERLRRARELADRLGSTPTRVALAWVIRQPHPTFALIGPRTTDELADSLGALDVPLTEADCAWLNLER